ncbi:DNA cytosine methyltransferase [Neisseria sp. Dent CA1/247]|uniref:DNA cytosine methyltransferase n=1 Tax=Neisseria sp. Dent CA1/247 TaxID=2912675 RepID=UPI001FD2D8F4|nr:DNA cytosine methyltransferase [Neisseria sp. Dent CA1/247]UOO77961.1 DNA cytosine methyltransferase [Neisseria sp. Dent CA1/247]
MKYGSVCSGVEAASLAWEPLGFKPVFFSEIEKFPSAVLKHRWPQVPNLGDMTKFKEWPNAVIDILVGGTPCQSFSIAGLRKGLDDPRGNLMLTYLAIADKYRPAWVVWENVPGVLSSNGGRDFAAFITGLGQLGYGVAYRVLDAQYFGVPQRRRRVFVVGHLGNWQPAAAVLFEFNSLRGRIETGRSSRPHIAADTPQCFAESGFGDYREADADCGTVKESGGALGGGSESLIVVNGRQDPITSNIAQPLDTDGGTNVVLLPIAATLSTGFGGRGLDHEQIFNGNCAINGMRVRRFTPLECERLQGFPDNHTRIPWRGKPAEECPDAPRYKACGNSMAVPVMRWIGERIKQVSEILSNVPD